MGLAEAAQSIPETRAGQQCGIAFILDHLPDDDQALLQGWLFPADGEPRKANKWIASVLTSDGHKTATGRTPSDQIVSHHRQRNCGCFR